MRLLAPAPRRAAPSLRRHSRLRVPAMLLAFDSASVRWSRNWMMMDDACSCMFGKYSPHYLNPGIKASANPSHKFHICPFAINPRWKRGIPIPLLLLIKSNTAAGYDGGKYQAPCADTHGSVVEYSMQCRTVAMRWLRTYGRE